MFQIRLGVTVKDRLTGFSGVVTGRCDYITGCNQYLIRPTELKPDGDMKDAQWLDEQRLEVIDFNPHPAALAVQEHTDAAHPGADSPAPIK